MDPRHKRQTTPHEHRFPILTREPAMMTQCLALADMGCRLFLGLRDDRDHQVALVGHSREASPPGPSPDAHQSPLIYEADAGSLLRLNA
jgi:hypothetical protein